MVNPPMTAKKDVSIPKSSVRKFHHRGRWPAVTATAERKARASRHCSNARQRRISGAVSPTRTQANLRVRIRAVVGVSGMLRWMAVQRVRRRVRRQDKRMVVVSRPGGSGIRVMVPEDMIRGVGWWACLESLLFVSLGLYCHRRKLSYAVLT